MPDKKKSFPSVLTNLIEHFFQYLLMLLMAMILVIIPLQVFCRFVLQSSLPWPDEMAPFVLAWITFIGAVLALRNGEHISFDVIVDRISGKLRISVLIFRDLIGIIFYSVLFYFSIPIVIFKWPDLAYTFSVSRGFLYLCVTIGSFFLLVFTAANLVRNIQEHRNTNRR